MHHPLPLPARRAIVVAFLLAQLLAACTWRAAPPAVAPSAPAAAAPTPTPRPAPAPPSPTGAAAPAPSPQPTPAGPLTRIAAWGEGAPLGAAYTPDGRGVAVLRPGSLELRDAGLADLRWRVALDRPAAALAVAGDIIALAVGPTIELRAAADGSPQGEIVGGGALIADIAISPDGSLIAAAQDDQRIILWDLAERSQLRELRLPEDDDAMIVPGGFTSLAFAPDGQTLAAGDDGGNVGLWQVSDGGAAQVFSVGLRVVADVAISPDGRTVGAASQGWRSEPGAIWIWDLASGAELHWLSVDDGQRFLAPAERLAFAPDGASVLMGLADGGLLRWALPDGDLAQELPGHSAAITGLSFEPGGAAMLSASRDGSLRTWRADGAAAAVSAAMGAISALAVGPDGALLASGDEGGAIDLWRPDGAALARIASDGGQVNDLAISPGGDLLASAGHDGAVRLWRLPGGAPAGELRAGEGPALALAFAPAGELLAAAGYDGAVRLWRLSGGEPERTIVALESDGMSDTSIFQLAFARDGATLAVAGREGAVSIWRVADGGLIERRPIDGAAWVAQVAYGDDGGLLARDDGGRLLAWAPAGGDPALVAGPGVGGAARLPGGDIATLAGAELQIWRPSGAALARYADAAALPQARLAAGPGLLALGSRAGQIEIWAVR